MALVVKVCGLTRLEDALGARDAGADWLGFILTGATPRLCPVSRAGEIAAALKGTVETVAVFVEPRPDEALRLAERAGARRVQVHRVDPAGWPEDFPLPVTFALTVKGDGRVGAGLPPARSLLLLDTADAVLPGGTGRTFPWKVAARLAAERPLLLAGGLAADNVGTALTEVRPFGVDASSRLETAPGIKDPARVRAFVRAVRAWEAEVHGADVGPPPERA